jgi:photosystem II stability/assembly factor-like uncharacterized protein
MEIGKDFLTSEEGMLWLETDEGKSWLASPEGKEYVVGEVLRIAALQDSAMFAKLGQAILAIEKAQKEREKKNQA